MPKFLKALMERVGAVDLKLVSVPPADLRPGDQIIVQEISDDLKRVLAVFHEIVNAHDAFDRTLDGRREAGEDRVGLEREHYSHKSKEQLIREVFWGLVRLEYPNLVLGSKLGISGWSVVNRFVLVQSTIAFIPDFAMPSNPFNPGGEEPTKETLN